MRGEDRRTGRLFSYVDLESRVRADHPLRTIGDLVNQTRDYLDLCGPAMLDIRTDGRGEIVFGALRASLDLAYGRSDVAFDWEGSDDMHEVSGSGSAELLDDGSLEIEFEYRHGDELILKAERATPAATC